MSYSYLTLLIKISFLIILLAYLHLLIPDIYKSFKLTYWWVRTTWTVESISSESDFCRFMKSGNECTRFYARIDFTTLTTPLVKHVQINMPAGSKDWSLNYPTTEASMHTGELVDIVYDPRDPQNFKEDNFMSMWGWSLIWWFILLIIIGVIKKNTKSKPPKQIYY